VRAHAALTAGLVVLAACRAALAAALVVLAASTVAGCSDSGHAVTATGPGSAASANRAAGARGTAAAQATAQTEFGLLAGGDFAGAWDLWSATAQAAISRPDFVRLNAICPPPRGIPTSIVEVRMLDDSSAVVSWRQASTTGTSRLVYAGGAWRYEPEQSTMDKYRRLTRLATLTRSACPM
jgi:hypothetical protein